MKVLLLNCNRFQAKKINNNHEELALDCLVVLVTFENGDNQKNADKIIKEISKNADLIGTKNIVIGPFAHLSNDLLDENESVVLLKYIELALNSVFNILVSEFGAKKGLLLDIAAEKNNIKFRSY